MQSCRAFALAILLLSTFLQAQQDSPKPISPPRVRLILPSNIQLNDVQISYFQTGPFGGYGGLVSKNTDRHSIEISTQVEGIDAKDIKIIAYLPGCAFKTYSFKLDHLSDIEQSLDCHEIPFITIKGKIVPAVVAQYPKAKVTVYYLAHWSMKFFGIMDGPVTVIRIGNFNLDESGAFSVPIPDFTKDPMFESVSADKSDLMTKGDFSFRLTDQAGHIANFVPKTAGNVIGNLAVLDSYPDPLEFDAKLDSSRAKNQVNKNDAKPKD